MSGRGRKQRKPDKPRMGRSVQQYLGVPESWPVVEKIPYQIVLMPTKQDIKNGKRRDPLACALHNAACRMFNVPNAAIGKRWAYIPQRDEKGRPFIARMQAPQATTRAIDQFDRTGKMPEGGFRFIPVAPTHMLKAKKRYNRKWYAGEVGHNRPARKVSSQNMKRISSLRNLPRGKSLMMAVK